MTAVKPEEVYLSVLCHYFVHPPAVDQVTYEPLDPKQSSCRIALFLLKTLKTQASAMYPSLRQLCVALVSQLGSLGSELVRQLEVILQGLSSPDDLANIMEATGALLVTAKTASMQQGNSIVGIDPHSVMGLFLRRVRATWLLAPYSALLHTTTALQEDMRAAAAEATAGPASESDAVAMQGSLVDPVSMERFLNRQLQDVRLKGTAATHGAFQAILERIQSSYSHAAVGAGVLDANISNRSSNVHQSCISAVLPRLLQLQLAAALAECDYIRALHHMHAYFDRVQCLRGHSYGWSLKYASHHLHSCEASGAPPPLQERSTSSGPTSTSHKAWHHSALLSLAALHAHFGHTQEALDALNEAMRAAQQHNDQHCLLHCLAGLCQVMMEQGTPADSVMSLTDGGQPLQLHRLLHRCLARAQELGCPHLAVFARLGLAKWSVQHTIQPSQAGSSTADAVSGVSLAAPDMDDDSPQYETKAAETMPALQVVQAACQQALHTAHAACLEAAMPLNPLVTSQPAPPNPAAGPAPAPVARTVVVPELYVPPRVFQAPATWGSAPAMAQLAMQHATSARLLHASAWHLSGNPRLSHLHSLVYLACGGGCCRPDDVQLALAQLLSNLHNVHGPAAARAAGHVIQASLPGHNQPGRQLLAALAKCLHEEACAQGCVHAQRHEEQQLMLLAGPLEAHCSELQLEALLVASKGALARGDMTAARDTALDCFHRSRIAGHQAMAMRCLLLCGKIWLAANSPTHAQPYLHSCLVHATGANQDLLAAEAACLLVSCWLSLSPQLLPELLLQAQDVLPLVFAHGSLPLRSESCWMLADVLLADTTDAHIEAAAPYAQALLQGALQSKAQLGKWEEATAAGALLALLHDRLGDAWEREVVAKQVLHLQERLQQARLCDRA